MQSLLANENKEIQSCEAPISNFNWKCEAIYDKNANVCMWTHINRALLWINMPENCNFQTAFGESCPYWILKEIYPTVYALTHIRRDRKICYKKENSLWLIKHQNNEGIWGSAVLTPRIPNFGVRCIDIFRPISNHQSKLKRSKFIYINEECGHLGCNTL